MSIVTMEELVARPLSYSSLKEFGKSPAHFIEYRNKKREPTVSQALGSAIHQLILEPEVPFESRFSVIPKGIDRRSKEGKARFAEIELNASVNGKTLIQQEDEEKAKYIASKVLANKEARTILDACGLAEVRKEYTFNGLPFVSIFDKLGNDFIVEVKTISDGSPESIMRDFFNYKYHLQGAMYCEAEPEKKLMYIIAETNAPYNITVMVASDSYLELGYNQLLYLSDKFTEAMTFGMFDAGYEFHKGGGILLLEPPAWAAKGV